MISIFHFRALIAACIVLLFAALIPQGSASGPTTSCDTCVKTATNGWCIKDYGTEVARNCVTKDPKTYCLGGTIPDKCPDAPPVAYPPAVVALVPDPNTCAACSAAGGQWCTKTTPLRQCIASTKVAMCAETGSAITAATACSVPVTTDDNRAETTVLTTVDAAPVTNCATCITSVSPSNRWCLKSYGTTVMKKFCVATVGIGSTSCLGGRAVECSGATGNSGADATGAADYGTCTECKEADANHVWCIKTNGVRTCMTTTMATGSCDAAAGDVAYTTCYAPNMDATTTGKVDVVATAPATACDECVKTTTNSWCMKDFGTTKPSYCVLTAEKDMACLGGTPVRSCTPPDHRQTAPDKKNCDECEKAKQNWCIKGAGSAQVRACVPVGSTDCDAKEITLCKTITGNALLPTPTIKTTAAPTTNTTKPNRASTLGVSAVPFFTVLGAITVLG